MKLVPLALAVALSPMGLAAQNAGPAPIASLSNFNVRVSGNGCPASLELEQRVGNQLVTVQKDGRIYKAPATQLFLTITPSSSTDGVTGNAPWGGGAIPAPPAKREAALRAASATATAYGFGGQPRFELISPGSIPRGSGSSGPTRNVQLHFSANDGSSVAELWLPSFGAVRWLELDSITWSDGSSWKPASGESCTVSPSGIMLIGADSQAGRSGR